MLRTLLADRPRWSAAALALALTLGSAWWSAATAMTLLHDDARFSHALSAALDQPAVRTELDGWVGTAIEQGSSLSSVDLARQPVVTALRAALTSDTEIGPMADALTQVTLAARDQAVDQLDRRATPKRPVRLDLGPLLTAAGIKVDRATAKQLGLPLDKRSGRVSIQTELLSADQLQAFQRRYDLTRLVRDVAGWVALGLLAVSVATSRRPFLTLAIACAVGAVAALAAPVLVTHLATWIGRSALGALLQPVVLSLGTLIRPLVLPVVLVGSAGFGGFLAAHLVLVRRRARPS